MPAKRVKRRCPWGSFEKGDELYIVYHDSEWGVPLFDDRKIFEYLTLEAFQAGLSWRTVLYKRKNFEKAFANFVPAKVAKFTARDVARLLKDAGIIRNRAKIEATIENAKQFLKVQKEFGTFAKYQWSFVGGKPIQNKIKTLSEYPVTTSEAIAWAKDLKRRGFKFLGPTVLYAHMQAVGMANDHTVNCFRHKEVARMGQRASGM